MNPQAVLAAAMRALPPDAWESEAVSDNEVFAAAAASLAAYAHTTAFELENTRRAIVIPSETFRQQIQSGTTMAAGVVAEADATLTFVETRYFVAAVVKCMDYVVVAYRGTADGYDLFLDMNFGKEKIPAHNGIQPRVHGGFLKGFLEGLPHVHKCLAGLEPFAHLIGAGHSLGGAICSLHNAASNTYSNKLTNPLDLFSGRSALHRMRSCITFGSPKVGDAPFALFCPWGTNVYHPRDPVPMLPLSALGYARQPLERPLSEDSDPTLGVRKWLHAFRRKRRLIMFSEHSMEGYVRLCRARAGVSGD